MNPENTTLGIRSLETHADDSRKPSSTVHGIAPAERPSGRAVSIERLLPELRILMARELEIDEAKIDDNASFNDLGVDSIILMDLIGAIEQWLGLTVEPDSLILCDSIARTARYLADRIASISPPVGADSDGPGVNESGPRARNNSGRDSFKVAVIGMACRVPGAADLAEFWRNLEEGVDSVVAIPPDHRWGQVQAPDGSLRWAGLIDNHDSLYPKLFDMSAQEAVDVDPSVRLFTECGLQAIHDSPVGLDGVRGRRVGVFVGARAGRYGERIKVPGKRSITGVGQNFISSYLSHVLDLRGPNLVLDSACSSSLAAVHVACQSLEGGDCELAVAGGVDVLLDQKTHEFLSAAKALSADGRCRPFSRDANGFVPGEGVGAVVLKPLEKALADGDPVYAVIDGSAINNDGNTLGITTPSVDGQVDVIRRALERSGVSPKDISYVEAHGTGTMIGDPIELQSLARAYREDPPERCGVGSVKSNVGHLLSAAGIVSFIKVALSLHQRTIPPTLHCEEINPRIGFDRLPFYPVVAPTHWPEGRAGRKAGVSAFGFGKTNVHLILSERPKEAAMPTIQSRALPTELCGEQVRAWRDISAEDKSVQDLRPALMALQDVIVEEIA
jgi:acyl transferase domain-containing protein/acyl carrier protein